MPEERDPWGDETPPEQRPDPRKVVKQGGPEASLVNRPFKIAFFPVLGLSVISLLLAQFSSSSESWWTIWLLAVIYMVGSVVFAVGYAIVKIFSGPTPSTNAIIAGLLAGSAVSFAIIFTSCFVGIFIQFR